MAQGALGAAGVRRVWAGAGMQYVCIVEFNVPLDTVCHFGNGGPEQ